MSDSRRLKLNNKEDDVMKTLLIINGNNGWGYSEDWSAWNLWNSNNSIEANVVTYDYYEIYVVINGHMYKPTSFLMNSNGGLDVYYNAGNSSTSITALYPLTAYSGFQNGDPRIINS